MISKYDRSSLVDFFLAPLPTVPVPELGHQAGDHQATTTLKAQSKTPSPHLSYGSYQIRYWHMLLITDIALHLP